MLWDVRFLPNPYWVEELRPKTGKVREVADYVLQSERAISFFVHLEPLLQFLVEQNNAAGKENSSNSHRLHGGKASVGCGHREDCRFSV